MLLAAELPLPLDAVRRRRQRRVHVAAQQAHRRQHELARARGLDRVEPRRQRCVVDAGEAGGARVSSRSRATTANTGWPTSCTSSAARMGSSGTTGPQSSRPGMSAATSTPITPGAASTAARSIATMRAWACVDRASAACAVPAGRGGR